MRHGLIIAIFLLLFSERVVFAEPGVRFLSLRLFGEWEEDIEQRLDLRLGDTLSGLTLRALLVDRGPPTVKYRSASSTALRGGLYHTETGSRILFGPLQETGLVARIQGPWGKGIPYAENHQPSMDDLLTDADPGTPNSAYLFIGTKRKAPWRIYGATTLSEDESIGATIGLQYGGFDHLRVLIEGTYFTRTLDTRSSTTWFSEERPLPERRLYITGTRVALLGRPLSIASDIAYSYAENQGGGFYGNLALDIHGGPLFISLCAETVTGFYTDPEGVRSVEGYRWGTRVVGRPMRSRTITLEGILVSPTLQGPVTETEIKATYRRTVSPRTQGPVVSAVSFTTKRDRSLEIFCKDEVSGSAALRWGVLRLHIFGTAQFERPLRPGLEAPSALPLSGNGLLLREGNFGSALTLGFPFLQVGGSLERIIRPGADSSWSASVDAALIGTTGRLSLYYTLASEEKPWVLRLTWRKFVNIPLEKAPTGSP